MHACSYSLKYTYNFVIWYDYVQHMHVGRTDLDEIRYRFTVCNATGQDGPEASQCLKHYSETKTEDVYLSFPIRGLQGFTVPKTDVYTVTVAGAGGGRGLCNIHNGQGVVIRKVMELSHSLTYGVMVGQSGINSCDVTQEPPECPGQLRSVEESKVCEEALRNRSDDLASYYGGGGGGGSSSFWEVSSHQLLTTNGALLIAGGGGGSSQLLDYSMAPVLASLQSVVNCSGVSNESCYLALMNARRQRSDPSLHGNPGNRGYRLSNSLPVGGVGGGLKQTGKLIVDGRQLRDAQEPGVGGFPCTVNYTSESSGYSEIFGGFGGGGGGCTEGGGGGGYTGGDLLSPGDKIPGGGGYSLFNEPAEFIGFNDGDGYVEIMPQDCGCDFNCTVYELEYECACPGSDSYLAGDQEDCYTGMSSYIDVSTLLKMGRYYNTTMCHYWDMSVK